MAVKTIGEFHALAATMQHIAPTTPIESVLKQYAWANSVQGLDIVMDNSRTLRDEGIFEPAFLDAWCMNKYGTPNWTTDLCHYIFGSMDRQKLLEAGDPLPPGDNFTIYRGVAGIGAKRRVKGYSWTLSEEMGRHFCMVRRETFNLPDPALFQATVSREHVFAHINESGRDEQELIVDPFELQNVKRIWRETARKQAA